VTFESDWGHAHREEGFGLEALFDREEGGAVMVRVVRGGDGGAPTAQGCGGVRFQS
jgi:hypothetical protein